MQTLPKFKVLKGAEQPPEAGYHILLVHRFSADKRSLVHRELLNEPAVQEAYANRRTTV